MTGTLVERAAGFLESRLSRRNFISRSAMVGSALAVAGADYALTPGTAYGAICRCASSACSCTSACCSGFSTFCCSVNGGYNYCPSGTTIGGWWRATGSVYCSGPRYYLDCNADCGCTTGCGNGFGFCDTGCDGVACRCADGSCDHWATGCFQFRYGQCNQDVACMGRIVCRVVSCIPPWEVTGSCSTANAQDDGTANMNVPCNTAVPAPPPSPCRSATTDCQVVGIAATSDGGGYRIVTAFGRLFAFGDAADQGDLSSKALNRPIVGLASVPGGYWLVASDGGIFAFGSAGFHGSTGGHPLNAPMVGMAPTPSGQGYWTVAADGGIFCFGDAGFHGSMGGHPLHAPMVGMAPTPSGQGYWTVAADGGVFCFGDATFDGSMGGKQLQRPVVGLASPPQGQGYWLVAADGGIFSFDETFFGSPA